MRQQLPVRKLQERLLASIKLVGARAARGRVRDRFERVSATVVLRCRPPTAGRAARRARPTSQRVYEKYKSRFALGPAHPARGAGGAQAVRRRGDPARPASWPRAWSSARARGEDFAALARDYSEGPGAEQGRRDRPRLPAQRVRRRARAQDRGAATPGEVTDPIQDGGRFLMLQGARAGARPETGSARPARRADRGRGPRRPRTRCASSTRRCSKIREPRRARSGSARRPRRSGLATTQDRRSSTATTRRPQLLGVPEAADWGARAPSKGAVSPVFEGLDEFAIVQVAAQQPAGPAAARARSPSSSVSSPSSRPRVDAAKPKADAVAAALAQGRTLEQAAAAPGLAAAPASTGITRAQPDPRLGGAPELVGALFAATPGPGRSGRCAALNGWYFARVDERIAPPTRRCSTQIKGQITSEILQQRQQRRSSTSYLDRAARQGQGEGPARERRRRELSRRRGRGPREPDAARPPRRWSGLVLRRLSAARGGGSSRLISSLISRCALRNSRIAWPRPRAILGIWLGPKTSRMIRNTTADLATTESEHDRPPPGSVARAGAGCGRCRAPPSRPPDPSSTPAGRSAARRDNAPPRAPAPGRRAAPPPCVAK